MDLLWTILGLGALIPLANAETAAAQRSAPRDETRILVYYDMEGASGITSGSMFDLLRTPEMWARGRGFLIADVNNVVAGLFEGGATAVDVLNTHGGGGDTLVPRHRLDPRARILSRRSPQVGYDPAARVLDSGYAAVVAVAMHDKPLSGGFSPHTIRTGTTPVVNGIGLTEVELLGYSAGVEGVPLIFVSGDDVLGRSLRRTMPWVEYVVVKRTSGGDVQPLASAEVEASLRLAAARAVRGLSEPGRMRALVVTPPIQAGVFASYPSWISPMLADLPGIQVRGDTATFMADDYPAAYRGIRALMFLAASSSEGLMVDELRRSPEGRRLTREAMDTVMARWAAFEHGTWRPRR